MTKQELLEHIQSKMPFMAAAQMNSNLFDELGFDSGLLLDLILGIEERFGCRFAEEDMNMEKMSTPGQLWDLMCAAN